jgi:hypothetical protein
MMMKCKQCGNEIKIINWDSQWIPAFFLMFGLISAMISLIFAPIFDPAETNMYSVCGFGVFMITLIFTWYYGVAWGEEKQEKKEK